MPVCDCAGNPSLATNDEDVARKGEPQQQQEQQPQRRNKRQRKDLDALLDGGPQEPAAEITEEEKAVALQKEADKQEVANALSYVTSALKTTKSVRDRIARESESVGLIEDSVKRKKWGQGPVDYLRKETNIQTGAAAELLTAWLEMQKKMETCGEDLGAVRTLKEEAEAMTKRTNAVQQANKVYKTEVLAEMKKLKVNKIDPDRD